jgi:hypothetical protein
VTNFLDLDVAKEPNNRTFSQEKGDQKPKSSTNLQLYIFSHPSGIHSRKLVRTDKSTLSGCKDGLGVHGAHTALLFRKPSVQPAPFRHPSRLHPKLLGSDQQTDF